MADIPGMDMAWVDGACSTDARADLLCVRDQRDAVNADGWLLTDRPPSAFTPVARVLGRVPLVHLLAWGGRGTEQTSMM